MPTKQSDDSTEKSLHLALLGGLDVRVKGSPALDIGYAKLRGLLVYLALSADKPLRRDFLADLFWPEMTEVVARQNLRRALFNLKSALGDSCDLISAKRDAVTLTGQSLWLDVDEFSAAIPSCASPDPMHCDACLAKMADYIEVNFWPDSRSLNARISKTGCKHSAKICTAVR